jgi:DNA-binding Xre family transcriptional regulator/predicted transcriptional regulator
MKPAQEIEATFSLLKTHLKSRKISYADLAKKLKMSESNVKRIFSTQSCNLETLSEICAAAETSMFELISTASRLEILSFHLSNEAETHFLNNFDHFIFFRKLSAANDIEAFIKKTELPKERLTSTLESLQKINLIRKTRTGHELTVSGYMDLSKNPALIKKLNDRWVPWFFDQVLKNNNKEEYFLRASSTGLSKAHKLQMLAEIQQLIDKYSDIGYRDQRMGSTDFEAVGLCIGVGPHRVGLFEGADQLLPSKK